MSELGENLESLDTRNVKFIEIDEIDDGIPYHHSLLQLEARGDDIFITRIPSRHTIKFAMSLQPQPHQIVMKLTKEELLKIKSIRIYFEKIPEIIEGLKRLYNMIKSIKRRRK